MNCLIRLTLQLSRFQTQKKRTLSVYTYIYLSIYSLSNLYSLSIIDCEERAVGGGVCHCRTIVISCHIRNVRIKSFIFVSFVLLLLLLFF